MKALLAVLTITSFFTKLPSFFGALLDEAPMFWGAHYQERLHWLEATSTEAVSAFLHAASDECGVPDLAIDFDLSQLRRAEHIRDGQVWIIGG